MLYSTKYISEMQRSGIKLKALRRDCFSQAGKVDKMIIMPTIDMVATGKNIERLRKNAGISVRELQDVFGFGTPQAIYKWQHGAAMPTIDNLVVLSVVLQVKIDDILIVNGAGQLNRIA